MEEATGGLLAPPPPVLKTYKLGQLFRPLYTALKVCTVSNSQHPLPYPKQHKTMFELGGFWRKWERGHWFYSAKGLTQPRQALYPWLHAQALECLSSYRENRPNSFQVRDFYFF